MCLDLCSFLIVVCSGGLYEEKVVIDGLETVAKVEKSGEKLSSSLPSSGFEDISLLTMQRLMKQ